MDRVVLGPGGGIENNSLKQSTPSGKKNTRGLREAKPGGGTAAGQPRIDQPSAVQPRSRVRRAARAERGGGRIHSPGLLAWGGVHCRVARLHKAAARGGDSIDVADASD